jgi:hypothetical protein
MNDEERTEQGYTARHRGRTPDRHPGRLPLRPLREAGPGHRRAARPLQKHKSKSSVILNGPVFHRPLYARVPGKRTNELLTGPGSCTKIPECVMDGIAVLIIVGAVVVFGIFVALIRRSPAQLTRRLVSTRFSRRRSDAIKAAAAADVAEVTRDDKLLPSECRPGPRQRTVRPVPGLSHARGSRSPRTAPRVRRPPLPHLVRRQRHLDPRLGRRSKKLG